MGKKQDRLRRRRLMAGAGILAGIALLGGAFYWINSKPATGESQRAACVLVIDRSGSADEGTTVEAAKRHARLAVDGCAARRSTLSVFYFNQVDSSLVAAHERPFELWLPKARKQSNKQEVLDHTMADANKAVDSVFARKPGNARGSDIVTALDVAADNLPKGDVERHLIVVTDGIQVSTDISVESLKPDNATAEPLVEKAKQLALVPELGGANVWMVGVKSGTTDTNDHVGQAFQARVETFWRQLVAAGNGNVCFYNTAASELPQESCGGSK